MISWTLNPSVRLTGGNRLKKCGDLRGETVARLRNDHFMAVRGRTLQADCSAVFVTEAAEPAGDFNFRPADRAEGGDQHSGNVFPAADQKHGAVLDISRGEAAVQYRFRTSDFPEKMTEEIDRVTAGVDKTASSRDPALEEPAAGSRDEAAVKLVPKENHVAEHPFRQQRADSFRRIEEAVAERHHQPPGTPRRRLFDFPRIGDVCRQRLLAQHMQIAFERPDCGFGVKERWRADAQQFKAARVEQCFRRRMDGGSRSGEFRQSPDRFR